MNSLIKRDDNNEWSLDIWEGGDDDIYFAFIKYINF